jgi:hypothetical protein
MARSDSLHLQSLRGISGKLEHFSSEVFLAQKEKDKTGENDSQQKENTSIQG